jgi:hypothetical protein
MLALLLTPCTVFVDLYLFVDLYHQQGPPSSIAAGVPYQNMCGLMLLPLFVCLCLRYWPAVNDCKQCCSLFWVGWADMAAIYVQHVAVTVVVEVLQLKPSSVMGVVELVVSMGFGCIFWMHTTA